MTERQNIVRLVQCVALFYRTAIKKRLQTGDELSKTLSSSDCVMDSDIPKLVLTAVTVCQ